MHVGIDAHKKTCTVCVVEKGTVTDSFSFPTTREVVHGFMEKIHGKASLVIEASTTGKVLSRMLMEKYEVHMVAPPERKRAIKTDRRDAERIVQEDALRYLRRCYIPSPYIEMLRFQVMQQIQVGRKIGRVKNQVHALLERNMIHDLDEFSDIFGVEGLRRMAELQLPSLDANALGRHLEELTLHVAHHKQLETELAKIAEADEDALLLLTIPGIDFFTALAIKSRIGEIGRFPTKKHLCSYGAVVPGASNSGDYTSTHNHVKRGDMVLKYALTCAVRGAVSARKNSAVKRFYLKHCKRMGAQKAEVAAARKMACIVWKLLTTRQSYMEMDERLTARKKRILAWKAKRQEKNTPSDIRKLAETLMGNTAILEKYPEDFNQQFDNLPKDSEEEWT
jgi:transposase